MKHSISITIAALLTGITFLVGASIKPNTVEVQAPSLGYAIHGDAIARFDTSTEVLASSTASTLILATSTSRLYAIIGNNSPTASIFLSLTGGGAAEQNKGIRLAPGEKYEINALNLYTGAIYARASTTSASTTVAARQ